MYKLTLLSRSYCHLCEDMLTALRALAGDRPLDVSVLDVDADADLLARYDELVPVLLDAEGNVLCHYYLDVGRVEAYFVEAAR
jgi:hypothetical protein